MKTIRQKVQEFSEQQVAFKWFKNLVTFLSFKRRSNAFLKYIKNSKLPNKTLLKTLIVYKKTFPYQKTFQHPSYLFKQTKKFASKTH
jgi:hypothetical protein